MSTTEKPGEPENRTAPTPAPAGVDLSNLDVILRFLLFAASLVAVVVLVTGNQTELVLFQGRPVPQPAKWRYSPAFVYFVVAFSVSGFYSIITTLASLSVIQRPHQKTKFLLHFLFWDALILGIIASATGAGAGVAYIGLKGNSHVHWNKICSAYDTFCKHVAGSLAVGLFGSIVVVLLIFLSAFTLHSRVPK
ncbi:CASP-like protein 1D2 [Arachis duranensis]|uniref:CASP-like protein n=1 Tax=Arachis duranensis TaxID=130453 RepID=A0A6P4BFN5_ARADU|nr:CASP-like protein 1D2 [Arachis duranensis]